MALFDRAASRMRGPLGVALAIALASPPASAADATAPVGMHFEERPSRALFWTGFGLVAFGYAAPALAFSGGALVDASSSDASGMGSSWSHDAAPWLVPYAGPFLYLDTHPNESAFWPVTFFAAQVVGTGLLVTSMLVKQRRLVPGEAPVGVLSVAPIAARGGGGAQIVGTF